MSNKIIIIDHDDEYVARISEKLRAIGFDDLTAVQSAEEAVAAFDSRDLFDLALVDMTLPGMDGLAMLDFIKNTSPGTECIMVTAINEARTAVECLKKGAYDYLVKPVAKDVLALTLPKALERKRLLDILDIEKRQNRLDLTNPAPFAPIITRSPCMRRLLKEAELHAASNVPILITGESGSGKELLAWAIHAASPRAEYPFTPINLASISASLFEAEFFGQPGTASVGAASQRSGFLEHTHKGTLFLDEIGDLPLALQGKLLRVLQEGEFSRVGSGSRVLVDLRFIAATNENLDRMIARKAFRKDLYYRIRGGWLHLPPLRERISDIPLLINSFMDKYDEYTGKERRFTPGALDQLSAYSWPGNVRELKSVIQLAVGLAQGQPVDTPHLPEHLRKSTAAVPGSATTPGKGPRRLADVEKAHILDVYKELKGNKSLTARELGIGLNTLRRKLVLYGVD